FAARLRRGETGGGEPALVPDPDHRHEPFPATDVQRAYWMGRADDFALGGVGSHWYWEFDGVDVDIPRLERALNALIRRHDMLRAVFDDDGRQRVLPEVDEYVIEVADGDEALTRLRQSLSCRIPDPGRWPLIEVRAVRYGAGRTRLGFSFDYIVLDALSIVRFFGELTARYDDPEAGLPPLRITFRDYVLGAAPPPDEVAAAQRYWSERIDTLPPAPPLPLAKDPSEITAPQFHRREDWLPPRQWRALTDQAQRHNLTPAAVLAAAFAEVLTAWSGRDSVTLNLTMFNRRDVHPDIENVLGDFTSLLLVPHHAAADDSFLAAGHRFQERLWEGMSHGAVSALWVLRELARRTEASAVSMPVVFTSALGVAGELTELTFPFGRLVWGISQTPQVWLDNQVMERDGGLAYNWDSVDELFCDGALDAMFDAYRRLLRWLATTDWSLPAPDLLPAEQRVVREKVNRTAGAVVETTLHGDFFTRAATAPDRVAVLHGDEQVTYGELADRALRVAGWLREEGLRPGEPVEVRLPRGPDQVAAVLGVLAAGGAYVPIGLDQPEARRDRIRTIAGVRLAVTGDLPSSRRDGEPPTAPVHDDPDQLAYVIFTSGSTGEPKGVEITHRAAMNTIVDINDRFGVGPQDRVLAVSSLDFDLSVYDIFGLLSAGGALVLVGEDDRREARSWVELIGRHRVTVWNSVPALLEMTMVVAEGADPNRPGLDSLRLVLASGDWVGMDLPGRVRRAAPGARFVALGGATEAAIWSNAHEVDAVPPHWRSVPYGLPLRNQRYRVVGARDRDCPDWVVGELHIGGAGVARGYRNDPATTAEHFVEHAGGRWYRTGDLGRYWSNGILEFRGRSDSQVKIRGHRIELGEVAAAAESHPDVAHAIALTVGQDAGRHLVVAVVGGSTAARPDPTAVAGLLADRLPSYMVPERIAVLDRLPLSGNGKVDRRQVAAQLEPAPAHDEPPQGETEEWLAELWRDLLDHDTVARNDSFFLLGGDSLLATRLVETIRRRTGVPLALRELFAAATVARLATLVDARRGAPGAGEYEEGTL
ncbi:MAG: non-ribosomal peptide synthetase, partial [Micromonosporaceae bacterium]